jgi:hypothetical protein
VNFWTACGAVLLVLFAIWVAKLALRFLARRLYSAVARAQLRALQVSEPELAEWLRMQPFEVVAAEDIITARKTWELRKDIERARAERKQLS